MFESCLRNYYRVTSFPKASYPVFRFQVGRNREFLNTCRTTLLLRKQRKKIYSDQKNPLSLRKIMKAKKKPQPSRLGTFKSDLLKHIVELAYLSGYQRQYPFGIYR